MRFFIECIPPEVEPQPVLEQSKDQEVWAQSCHGKPGDGWVPPQEEESAKDAQHQPVEVHTAEAAVRQPQGQCDPESPLPCSCPRRNFTDPQDYIPMPATKSNVPALEAWIRNYFKSSAFNQCRRQSGQSQLASL